VASDGAVYFSDSGNGRVREVAPNGIITTVGETVPLSSTAVPALEATPGQNAPAGLAIGPDRRCISAPDRSTASQRRGISNE
jgi:hypothetical protein